MADDTNDMTMRRPALWRRMVAGALRAVARMIRRFERDPRPTEVDADVDGDGDATPALPVWPLDPETIAPYDQTVRRVLEIDQRPYRMGDHWSQVIERLQATTDRPYQPFVHGDDLWIQRTPDIDAPLIVSGAPGERSFLLMTASTDYEWTGDSWIPFV